MVITKPTANIKAKETASQNGKDTKTGTKPAELKPLPSIAPEPKISTLSNSIQGRLKKLAELQSLADRRNLLIEHLDNVSAFDYNSPDSKGVIRFTDNNGVSFQFSNAGVIGEVVPIVKARLESQLNEIESQISF